MSFLLIVIYTECYKQAHYAECNYAQCHYAECHYAECRTAITVIYSVILAVENVGPEVSYCVIF